MTGTSAGYVASMARPLRIIEPGETYHVFSRGSNRLRIFFDDRDFNEFLVQLGRIVGKYRWRLNAYCLIPNHYHLLASPSESGLSNGMREQRGLLSADEPEVRAHCASVPQSLRPQVDRERGAVRTSGALRRPESGGSGNLRASKPVALEQLPRDDRCGTSTGMARCRRPAGSFRDVQSG